MPGQSFENGMRLIGGAYLVHCEYEQMKITATAQNLTAKLEESERTSAQPHPEVIDMCGPQPRC